LGAFLSVPENRSLWMQRELKMQKAQYEIYKINDDVTNVTKQA